MPSLPPAPPRFFRSWPLAFLVLLIGVVGAWTYLDGEKPASSTVTIGVLHSLSGTMAADESALVDAARLAVEELNAAGGIAGHPLEIKLADGRSDPAVFAAEAERLITHEHAAALFGCWTSSCRKAVKEVVERHDQLLFYPLQYEGLEQSPNIVYLGEAPNQQIIPATSWALHNLGKRLFLIGSDYVFPRIANTIIRRQAELLGGTIVGEEYRPLGDGDFAASIQRLEQAKPDVVLNTINGDSNRAFFTALRGAGLTPEKLPVLSFSVAEGQNYGQLPGDYAAWSYFQSIPTPANRRFVDSFRRRFGADRPISSPMEASYSSIKLWAAAAAYSGGDFSTPMVRSALVTISIGAPSGPLLLDKSTQHAWKPARIGRLTSDGGLRIVWSTEAPIQPEPFPLFFTRKEWQVRLEDLYRGYGNRWDSRRGSP